MSLDSVTGFSSAKLLKNLRVRYFYSSVGKIAIKKPHSMYI